MNIFEKIAAEFPSVSHEQWTQQFLKEIKKESIDSIQSILGFNYAPIHSASNELKDNSKLITQLLVLKGKNWNVNSVFSTENPVEQNKKIIKALETGTSSITLSGEINDLIHFSSLLKDVEANYIEINFRNHSSSLHIAKLYKEWCISTNKDTSLVFGVISCDPIANASINGKWKNSKNEDLNELLETFKFVNLHFTQLRCISIDSTIYHYSGANSIQTLAYSIGHALEYLNFLNSNKIPIEKIYNRIVFNSEIGLHFFAEISSMRAFYILWNNLINSISSNKISHAYPFIHAQSSFFNWSCKDVNSNLIRATTQSMAAISGGATSIYVNPFDVLAGTKNDNSTRISKNVLLLLKAESFMDKTIDPTGGSYFVEELTQQFASNALEKLKTLEAIGGLIAELENGSIQKQIEVSANEISSAYKSGKIKIIGSNCFPIETIQDGGNSNYFKSINGPVDFKPLNRFILEMSQ